MDNQKHCPDCGKVVHWDESRSVLSCVFCNQQLKILYIGSYPPEEEKRED